MIPRIRLFFFCASFALAICAFAETRLICPPRAGQGEPLLVWAVGTDVLDGVAARVETPAGARVAWGSGQSSLAFAAPKALSRAARGGLRAYGFLIALPVDAAPGSYRFVLDLPASEAPSAMVLSPMRPASNAAAGPAASPPAASNASSAASNASAESGASTANKSGLRPSRLEAAFILEARHFFSEDIRLGKSNTALRSVPDPRKEQEARKLSALLASADPGALFLDGEPFILPVLPRRKTSAFGDKRRYLYEGGGSDSSMHAGLDLAVPWGTPVLACAPGRVVFSAERIVTGGTLVIEHLPGLYSIYMHLASLSAAPGETVDRGQRIAFSGSTGLSTGPHLHWELRVLGRAVDPRPWLAGPSLDKALLASTMDALIEGR